MSVRTLALTPFALGAVALVLVALTPASLRDAVVQGEVDVSKGLALAGLAAAASAFSRGDYLRRGWGALALSFVFFLARDAMLLVGKARAPVFFEAARAVFVTAGNATLVVGMWTLARAWTAAGLEYAGPRWVRHGALAVAVIVAVALAGPILVVDVRDLAAGLRSDYEMLGSDVGDLLSLPVVAPIVLTAVTVRHGSLRWPWTLLAASLLASLLYDGVYILPDYVAAAPREAFHFYSEQLHVAAGTFALAAGLAQRHVVKDEGDH